MLLCKSINQRPTCKRPGPLNRYPMEFLITYPLAHAHTHTQIYKQYTYTYMNAHTNPPTHPHTRCSRPRTDPKRSKDKRPCQRRCTPPDDADPVPSRHPAIPSAKSAPACARADAEITRGPPTPLRGVLRDPDDAQHALRKALDKVSIRGVAPTPARSLCRRCFARAWALEARLWALRRFSGPFLEAEPIPYSPTTHPQGGVGATRIGVIAKMGAGKTRWCPNPSPKHPCSGRVRPEPTSKGRPPRPTSLRFPGATCGQTQGPSWRREHRGDGGVI